MHAQGVVFVPDDTPRTASHIGNRVDERDKNSAEVAAGEVSGSPASFSVEFIVLISAYFRANAVLVEPQAANQRTVRMPRGGERYGPSL